MLVFAPDGGVFTNGGRKVGWVCGITGYIKTEIVGVEYLLHRLVFYYFNGWCPDYIDHADGNQRNNSPMNLRAATHSQNIANAKKRPRLKGETPVSKYKGVSWHVHVKKWNAKIGVNGRRIHLGYFDSEEEASVAYINAAKLYFGEYNRGF